MMALICSDYGDFKEYGGHYYTVTSNKVTFTSAKTLAENNGGYLAIPNSAQENAFITSLIKGGQYAWIGIYDPNYTTNYCVEGGSCVYSDSRFRTVKNSTLAYKNWATNQPDNLLGQYDVLNGKDQVSPLGEHWVALGSPSGQWGDFGNHADEYNNPVKYYAVFEFDTMPECYTAPSTVTDTIEGKQCNTQVYDTTLDTVTTGKTYNCLNDAYGTSYCPASLASCSTEWDYAESTSVEHKICSDGTAPINGKCKSAKKACEDVGGTWNGSGGCTVSMSYEATSGLKADYTFNYGVSDNCYGEYTGYDATTTGSIFAENPVLNLFAHNGCGSANIQYLGGAAWTGKSGNRTTTYCPAGYEYAFWGGGSSYYRSCSTKPVFNAATCQITYNQHLYLKNKIIDQTITVTGACDLICTNGGTLSGSTCNTTTTVSPTCSDVSTDGYCMTSPNTYYEYLCSGTNSYGNTYTPVITTGASSTPPPNNCKAEGYKCQSSPDRKCALVDSKWQCSPFPCISGSDIETTDTEVGLTDASNDGWTEGGDCIGQIYIFNGQDNRCRSGDIFFGLFGGGCCDKDKVFLGLVACKDEEKKLAKLQKQERTHYVGEYCSKKLKFIGCIQKKKTFCAFNSKLGRIINEQGRTQLNKGWGDPKSPNCKGFTPEEFQKLDFSKLDLSEFFGDLQQNFNSAYIQNQQTVIQNRMNTNLQNIAGQ